MPTMAEQAFALHIGNRAAKRGEIVVSDVDLIMTMDNAGTLASEIEKTGLPILNPDRLAVIPDHNVPANTIRAADNAVAGRAFSRDLKHFFDIGRGGISHLVVPEAGLCHPGDIIIGTDSHTCTYGAFGAFSTGVGFQDAAACAVLGRLWFRVPESIKVVLDGEKPPLIQGKDIALKLLKLLGVDQAIYMALEFTGPGLATLDISDRVTIANMAVELGAKAGLFEVDEVTCAYFHDVHQIDVPPERRLRACEDEAYHRVVHIDLTALEPMLAAPFIPSNVHPVSQMLGVQIDQAFVGSCGNGRIEDMRMAAEQLRGKKLHPRVRMIVLPGTRQVMLQMIREGLAEVFLSAGAVLGSPTCGPCSGTHMGLLGDKEVCIATTNRNYKARMGSPGSFVYLANPAVVAASAVAGEISLPEEVQPL